MINYCIFCLSDHLVLKTDQIYFCVTLNEVEKRQIKNLCGIV